MQLSKSALQKIPSSTRRSGRSKRFSFASFLSLLVFFHASSASAANWACTEDMTPIRLDLKVEASASFSGASTDITIPKSYIIDPEQWSGGEQRILVLGIDANDMSPLCKNHSKMIGGQFGQNAFLAPDRTYEDAVWIHVRPTKFEAGVDHVGKFIELERKVYTELVSEDNQGFTVYKNPLSPSYKQETLHIPHEGLFQNKVKITCMTFIGKEDHGVCEAHAREKDALAYSYTFKAKKWMKDLPTLDGNIRKLLDQFSKH